MKLAAVAVTLAVFMIVAADGASAAVSAVSLCKSLETVCQEANTYGAKTVIQAQANSLKLLGALMVECKESALKAISGESAEKGKVLEVSLEEWTFTACEPCTSLVAMGLPYKAKLSYTKEGNGVLVINGLKLSLKGCPFGTSCLYEGAEVPVDVLGGVSPRLFFGGEFERKEGSELFCSKTPTFDTGLGSPPIFTLSKPAPLFISPERQ
jgi:hypothetical protein